VTPDAVAVAFGVLGDVGVAEAEGVALGVLGDVGAAEAEGVAFEALGGVVLLGFGFTALGVFAEAAGAFGVAGVFEAAGVLDAVGTGPPSPLPIPSRCPCVFQSCPRSTSSAPPSAGPFSALWS
jgi:hypothetical protein